MNQDSNKNTSPFWKVTIIGSGGVATNTGKLLKAKGISVIEVLGRSEASTRALAEAMQCNYILNPEQLNQKSDLYIIAIQDKEIAGLIPKIKLPDSSLVVHTAGGVSIEVFNGFFSHYGVLYPLQSLRKETKITPKIPFYLDGNSKETKNKLEDFCRSAGLDYKWATDLQRIELHIAAVFCSNFTNYLYSLAEKFCEDRGLEFAPLLPIIEETASRLSREKTSPSALQTGPAIRGDQPTLDKHLSLLEGSFEADEVYRFLTAKIMASKLFK